MAAGRKEALYGCYFATISGAGCQLAISDFGTSVRNQSDSGYGVVIGGEKGARGRRPVKDNESLYLRCAF